MQLDHYSNQFNKRTFSIKVIAENVTNAPNIGSLFRTADAFGVEELVFCGSQITLGRKMMKTSRATEKSVKHRTQLDIQKVISELKHEGYFIVALEITSESKSLTEFNFPRNKPIALIIGDENFGVSEHILKVCDAIIHIDMYGQNSSMNVVQATSISLYEITKQLS
ncbi:TrmH family RNA methyltransferase [uncultured Psychroserpens sp.]|uniref:TrmH family RNA methyltransferase n=1 Tax=uncultured Psychroserpens sp. TaxID=255436 RepID=UPI00262BEEF0|nr:TrmH family RNA methyltransferase [uncultured Psychroserpens sp.]